MTEVEGYAATTAKDLTEEDQGNDQLSANDIITSIKEKATETSTLTEKTEKEEEILTTPKTSDTTTTGTTKTTSNNKNDKNIKANDVEKANVESEIAAAAATVIPKILKENKIDKMSEEKEEENVAVVGASKNGNGEIKSTVVIEYTKDIVDCANVVELTKLTKSQNLDKKDHAYNDVDVKKNCKSENIIMKNNDINEKLIDNDKVMVTKDKIEVEAEAEKIKVAAIITPKTVEIDEQHNMEVDDVKTKTKTTTNTNASTENEKSIEKSSTVVFADKNKPNEMLMEIDDDDDDDAEGQNEENEVVDKISSASTEQKLQIEKMDVDVNNVNEKEKIINNENSALKQQTETKADTDKSIKHAKSQKEETTEKTSTDTDKKENGIASSAEQGLNDSIITVGDDDDDDENDNGNDKDVAKKIIEKEEEPEEKIEKCLMNEKTIIDGKEFKNKNEIGLLVPIITNITTIANNEKDPLYCDDLTKIQAATAEAKKREDEEEDDEDNVDNNKLSISLCSDSDGAVVINSDSESETNLSINNNNNNKSNNNNNNSSNKQKQIRLKQNQQQQQQQEHHHHQTSTLPNITITATKISPTATTTGTAIKSLTGPTIITSTTTASATTIHPLNNNNNNFINTIDDDDDDDDDCVVIEDETTAPPHHHNNNNGEFNKRKNNQLDNGMNQIIDSNGSNGNNQPPPSKRLRGLNSSPVGHTLTLKDARSLVQQQKQQQHISDIRRDSVTMSTNVANIFPVNIAASVVTTTGTIMTNNNNSNITLTTTTTTSSATTATGLPKLVPMSSSSSSSASSSGSLGNSYMNSNPLTNAAAVVAAANAAAAATAAANAMMIGNGNIMGGVGMPTNATLLPGLTDDMFVLEAPSFIVPYIYEKPPADSLKLACRELEMKFKLTREDLADADKSDEFDMMTEQNRDDKDDLKTSSTSLLGATSTPTTTDKKNNKKRRRGADDPDESWSEESSEDDDDDDDDSDAGMRTKVLIKEASDDLTALKGAIKPASSVVQSTSTSTIGSNNNSVINISGCMIGGDMTPGTKSSHENYFESPLGKFFMDIGVGLVQEFVQSDLIRLQKRKMRKSLGKNLMEFERAITALSGNLEASRKKNSPFKFTLKRCEFCNFKSESALAMANHYETPHMNGIMYKCNFCTFEIRNATEIVYHMEAMHNIKARLIKPLPYHQCPNCGFEDNGKAKLARHQPVCAKKFRPEINLIPPSDWEAPAKIPRIKPRHGLVGTATAYQAMAAQAAAQKAALASIQQQQHAAQTRNIQAAALAAQNANKIRGRAPAPCMNKAPSSISLSVNTSGAIITPNILRAGGTQAVRQPVTSNSLPNHSSYPQLSQSSIMQQSANAIAKKTITGQPSISITPLPRQNASGIGIGIGNNTNNNSNNIKLSGANSCKGATGAAGVNTGNNSNTAGNNKAQYVICEICDGYIKDLDQLRNHMQWMHKVKIHPKMIYNRPPLNCQKCQFRFFTDQGLERHLLGSHGLVTSSMQEAANKGKDAGRCPVCGRMYQWKLLNHVSREHHMTLKPAHLSYKCTVCTATFGMYKQFETHVYTAHSTVAKKAMDGKKNNNNNNNNNSSSSSNSNMQNSNSTQSAMASITNISGVNLSNLAANITAAGTSAANLIANNQLSRNSLSSGNDALLKPLKINDEITIIPQPSTKPRITNMESHVID